MFKPTKILVPTDFSNASDKALQEAVDVAGQYHASITLLHVLDRDVQQCMGDYCLPSETIMQLEAENIEQSREMMKSEVSKIPGSASIEINFDVRHGATAEEILHEQQEKGADLIVMASHGRSGFSKMMLGSVSDKVLTKANTPILLVRA